MWFDQLTGFAENPTDVARYLQLDGTTLYSHANGRTFACGHFAAVSLASLQQQIREQQMSQPHSASQNKANSKRLTLREWVGDVQRLHADSRCTSCILQPNCASTGSTSAPRPCAPGIGYSSAAPVP